MTDLLYLQPGDTVRDWRDGREVVWRCTDAWLQDRYGRRAGGDG